MLRKNFKPAVRLLIFLSLPFVFAKSAFSIEQCVRQSLRFADCVDSTIVENASKLSHEELADLVVKTCGQQKKEYEACGQFEKSSFSADFIKVRVELFTQEKSKALAVAPAVADPSTN